ncbi:MAG TPA: hypothetical protein VFY89_03800 [Ktedonobacterales bacterium]
MPAAHRGGPLGLGAGAEEGFDEGEIGGGGDGKVFVAAGEGDEGQAGGEGEGGLPASAYVTRR